MSVSIHLRRLQRWPQSIARHLSPLLPQLSTFTHASSHKNRLKFKPHSCLPLSTLPLTLCRLDSETNQSFPLSAHGNLLLIDCSISAFSVSLGIPKESLFLSFITRFSLLSKGESGSCSVISNSLQTQGRYSPWNSPGQNTGVGSLSLLQGIFPTQGSNPGLPHCRQIIYQLSHKGRPRILESISYLFSSGSSWPRNWTRVSCIEGGFLTNWVIREDLFHKTTPII